MGWPFRWPHTICTVEGKNSKNTPGERMARAGGRYRKGQALKARVGGGSREERKPLGAEKPRTAINRCGLGSGEMDAGGPFTPGYGPGAVASSTTGIAGKQIAVRGQA